MSKITKKIAVIIAAGLLYSGSAYAGTIGCIELAQKGGPVTDLLNFTNGTDVYADCSTIAQTTQVANTVNIAYELTKNLSLDLEHFNAAADATHKQTIVYIPTTDIPSGTLIKMQLSGATWNEGGTLVLLKDGTPGAPSNNFSSVASTDGPTSGVDTITFVTKAGITVGSGTRLILSSSDPAGVANTYTSPKIKIVNSSCSPTATAVTLQVVSAISDGGTGYSIAGGRTAATKFVDISQQFGEFVAAPVATVANVDVETGSLRTKFVNQIVNNGVDKAQNYAAIYADTFTDNVANLDQAVTIANTDLLNLKFTTDIALNTNTFMRMLVFDKGTDGGASADTFATPIYNGTTANMLLGLTPTTYSIPATAVYHAADAAVTLAEADVSGKRINTVYFNLTNTDFGSTLAPMEYNYKVNATATLIFPANRAIPAISHCDVTKQTHSIGINGAVLKVPYMISDANTFLRISNEDTKTAAIFGDFEEGGLTCKNVDLGTVGANASVILKGDALLAAMASSSNAGCATLAATIPASMSTRFFGTFTVTSPKDKVHGYGVQKNPGGANDRVLSVLDQNSWIQ